MNLVPLTGLIYFMDSQILLKCLISFIQKVNNVINSHLPLKPLTRKESKFQTKPWITPGLKASLQIKIGCIGTT